MLQRPQFARDIMVTKLVTLDPKMDAHKAIDLLLKNKISGAPVVDEERNFLGVFSEMECMRVLTDAIYDQLPTNEIQYFLDPSPDTITEDTGILSIIQIFKDTYRRRLPVLRDGKVVGQISRRDILRTAHDLLELDPEDETTVLYLSALRERGEAPVQ
jgi:CBS domain-containing protein